MRRPLLLLLLAATLLTVAVVAVVLLDPRGDDGPGPAEDPFATTPLEDVDTLTLVVPRQGFCDRVDEREIEAALGAAADEMSGYENGDEVVLGEVTDVAHEYGCRWALDDGTEARAWVFAPPVDRDRARRLVREASRADGCSPVDGPAYGDPSLALRCSDGPATSTSYRGLFGDAWLTCELVAPTPSDSPEVLLARAGAWCGAVARGAAG
jgi:hypothetical protein